MGKALIIVATKTGETRILGQFIAEGLRSQGIETVIKNAREINKEADLIEFDAVILGSAIYFGDMLKDMKSLLSTANRKCLKGKVGASFGVFGWSGDVTEKIFDTMKTHFEMNMVEKPLWFSSKMTGPAIDMAHNYGLEIAKKIIG